MKPFFPLCHVCRVSLAIGIASLLVLTTIAVTFLSPVPIAHAACQPGFHPDASKAGLCTTDLGLMSYQKQAPDPTGNDIGFNPPNLCTSKNPINPNPQNGPTGPLGKALSGLEYNNESDGSDVYCTIAPPKNAYYRDTKDHNYQPGHDNPALFTIAGPLTKADLDQYCQKTLGVSGGPTGGGAQRDGDNAYAWQCHKKWGDKGSPMDTNKVCQQRFGNQSTRSRLNYYWSGNPQMWECLSQAKKLGGIILDPYCRDVKDSSGNQLYSKAIRGSTAYDIFCQAKNSNSIISGINGNSVKFDTLLDGCQWQHPQHQYIIDVLINYTNIRSWECWG